MVLKSWWMLLVWLAVVGVGFIVWRFVRRKQKHAPKSRSYVVPVAHSERLTQLPSYAKVARRYAWLSRGLLACLILGILSSLILTTRPASMAVIQPELRNRDIMLCLDVSGSMDPTNQQVIATFAKLAEKFDGERIGLTAFDSSANTVFPLTDDYDFVKDQFKMLDKEMSSGYGSTTLYTGTGEGEGSSLIGDGLASCVMRFDNLDIKRSRSIILVTDNYANGAQIVNLKQAGAYAKDKGVRVYGINPADFSSGSYADPTAQEFRTVVMATDGAYYKIDYESRGDASIVSQVVDKIGQQEATRFKGAAQVVQTDIPLWFSLVLVVSVIGLLGIAWRLAR